MALSRLAVLLACAIGAVAAFKPAPALADRVVYEYRVEHPRYGDIGSYTNIVEQTGADFDVETKLHIAVKFLGIVMYRQDARRSEHWHGNRLVSFRGVTDTNGDKIELRGDARGDRFLIRSPWGITMAPARVHPSNPWSAMVLNTDVMMSTKTGKIFTGRVTESSVRKAAFDGSASLLHQYEIDSDKRQFVWFDDRGAPVAFRTEENGVPIDFILTRQRALRSSVAQNDKLDALGLSTYARR